MHWMSVDFLVLGDVDRFFVFVLFDGHGVMDMGAGASTT